MYTKDEYEEKLQDIDFLVRSKIFIERKRFELWLTRLYSITNELQKEYNLYYNILFTTVVYELLTSGEKYTDNILCYSKDKYERAWFNRVKQGISNIKDQYSDNEYMYLEYRRNNACHIFLSGYDAIQDSGKIKEKRKVATKDGSSVLISIIDFDLIVYDVLSEYGGPEEGDKNFDVDKFALLSPIIIEMLEELNAIRLKEINGEEL